MGTLLVELIEKALGAMEVAKEWPYVFVTQNKEDSDFLMDLLIQEAYDNCYRVEDKKPGRVTFGGGAEYNFIVKESMDKWIHGQMFFVDVAYFLKEEQEI